MIVAVIGRGENAVRRMGENMAAEIEGGEHAGRRKRGERRKRLRRQAGAFPHRANAVFRRKGEREADRRDEAGEDANERGAQDRRDAQGRQKGDDRGGERRHGERRRRGEDAHLPEAGGETGGDGRAKKKPAPARQASGEQAEAKRRTKPHRDRQGHGHGGGWMLRIDHGERLGFGDMREPEVAQQGIETAERIAETLRRDEARAGQDRRAGAGRRHGARPCVFQSRRQQRQRRDRQRAGENRRKMHEGKGVAGGLQIGGGQDGRRVEGERGHDRARCEGQKLRPRGDAVANEEQRRRRGHDDEEGRILQADGEGERHQRGRRREARRAGWIEALQQETHRRGERHDLRRMMVDAAGRKLQEHRTRQGRQPDCRETRRRAGNYRAEPAHEGEKRGEKREGKEEPRRALGHAGWQKG